MNEQVAADIFRQAFVTIMLASAPCLLAALVVGLVISILQTVTQLHEATLSFVPKILAVMFCLVVFMPWMMQLLGQYTVSLLAQIPMLIAK
jgi:flagellar biosynthetic protein FliQ